jgi:hypothetical protein
MDKTSLIGCGMFLAASIAFAFLKNHLLTGFAIGTAVVIFWRGFYIRRR